MEDGMTKTMSGHERLELHDKASRLFLWAAGLVKHEEARQTIEFALREMHVAADKGSWHLATRAACEEGQRAQDALRTILFSVECAALTRGGSRRGLGLAQIRSDLAEAVAEWWLGRAAASELRAQVFRMALDRKAARARLPWADSSD
jgi:hypothetical protein